ncbi:MAG: double-strand break repair protein AddB [Proteobacteria bacterium]|nr:double-strand break repair protein AddB [Pseudomonadota bacterium]
MTRTSPKLFTIRPGLPFLDALAQGLLDRAGGDRLKLAATTVLLPTRRACRGLIEAFLRRSGDRAMLLPRLTPIGDVDSAELDLASAEDTGLGAALDLAPAISETERHLLLTRLILARGGEEGTGPSSADQAARLAVELARFLDQVETEGLAFDALAGLVPANYARHWQITLEFLGILTRAWPRILKERGCLDPAERRVRLLALQAEAWRKRPPATAVVAAGSTGSVPATASLLEVVAGLPEGAVILPGLDPSIDAATWEAITAEPTHPQHGLARLLARFERTPDTVLDWPARGIAGSPAPRLRLLAEALRPAATTEAWHDLPEDAAAGTAGLRRIDCPGPQEEAGVVALLLRHALEIPGRTAALVTPDRGLARRVVAELRRWDIAIDDSAGTPLADTAPGAFLRLMLDAAVQGLAPGAFLALLKHPLASGGAEPARFREAVRRLERAILRGPRPDEGFDGLYRALAENADIDADLRAALLGLLEGLEAALRPLIAGLGEDRMEFALLLDRHLAASEALAHTPAQAGAERLWAGEAGEAAAELIVELRAAAPSMVAIRGGDYPGLFQTLIGRRVVRPRYGRHPRLHIWGPLEARLQRADLMILGGLNEGVWPPEPQADPWLSRPMRAAFGLPSPERRIGLSAHDFLEAAAAPDVVLTRARRSEGTPTIPSRWLLRLEAVLERLQRPHALDAEGEWLGCRDGLDRPAGSVQMPPPMPRPPVHLRPRRLSVTQIETWMRDPYAIYARHILHLRSLDPVEADPGAADRGRFIHQAIDAFLKDCPGALPPDALPRLIAHGNAAFAPALARPGVWAFWWPRFERIAGWFLEAEQARRGAIAMTQSEVLGAIELAGPAGPFTLTAKADRIDRLKDGRLEVIDYKTGQSPGPAEVEQGYAPQLPLEALIAEAGAFAGVPAGPVAELAYWRLSGGEPAGEIRRIGGEAPSQLIAEAKAGLMRLIAIYDDPTTPYAPRPNPASAPRYSDYEHLARVKEWSSGDGGET